MGIAVHHVFPKAYHFQKHFRPFLPVGFGKFAHYPGRLHDNIPYFHAGRQGGVGVLEDDLYFLPDFLYLLFLCMGNIFFVKKDFAAGGLRQVDDEAGQGRFPAARLSYNAKRFPFGKGQGNAVQGVYFL